MKLYELNNELRNIIEHGKVFVSTETGEVFSREAIDELKLAREEKIEGCAIVIKEQLAMAKALKDEIESLSARAKSLTNHANWLKEYLTNNLNGEGFESDKCKLSFRKSTACEIVDETKIPSEFIKVEQVSSVMKKEILDSLKKGVQVPGCELVERQNLQVK